MQAIDIFSLQRHDGDYQSWPLKTQLLINGVPSSCYLPGYRLLYQFQTHANEYLLISDWDCPFEEATEIMLLDSEYKVLAVRSFRVLYGAFCLDEVQVMDPANLKLSFYRDDHWQLTITPNNQFCLHVSSGTWLPGFTTRLQLKRL